MLPKTSRRGQVRAQTRGLRLAAISRLLTAGLLLALTLALCGTYLVANRSSCSTNPQQAHCPHPVVCKDHGGSVEAPRPLVVISAGASRASSTLLYNALRILLRMRDPNTVAGWYLDLMHLYDQYAQPMERNGSMADKDEASRVDAFKSLGSVLIKLHTVRDWHVFLGGGSVEPVMEGAVDKVFVTHRDVRQSVRSIRDMGWGMRVSEAQRAHADFCRKKLSNERKEFLKPQDFEQESTWVNVARTQLQCREVMLRTAGKTLALDLKSEDLVRASKSNLTALLRQLGSQLEWEYTDAMLALAARELSLLRPVRCDSGYAVEMNVNPHTHMHKAHVHAAAGSSHHDRRGFDAIAADENCGRWLRAHGYGA